MSGFKKATRKQVKLKLSLTGPSGSGKTKSALRLAAGLGGKTAVIDTENGSASLYADEFDFDVMELHPPYTVEKYVQAVDDAEKAGYDNIIVDSGSHQWAGEGGLLDLKEQLDARAKTNKFSNWSEITKKHEQFKSAILHSPANLIMTLRAKQEYVLQDKEGKQVPKKVGMAPIQRDGLEYEFTVVFDIAMNHEAEASKDRTGLFAGKFFQITEETGQLLKQWLQQGEKAEPTKRPASSSDPALYRVKGGQFEGKLLSEIDLKELKRYVTWIKDDYAPNKKFKDGKYGPYNEFVEKSEQYIESLKAHEMAEAEASIEPGPPELDSDEEMPA